LFLIEYSFYFFNNQKWNILETQENSQAQGVLREHSEVHSYKVKEQRKKNGLANAQTNKRA